MTGFAKIYNKTGVWTKKQTFGEILADQLEIENAGGGANPILTSNSGSGILRLSDSLQIIGSLLADTFRESTTGHGLDLDGLTAKDEEIHFPTDDFRMAIGGGMLNITNIANTFFKDLRADDIRAQTALLTDVISELTTNNGVALDSVQAKDSLIGGWRTSGQEVGLIDPVASSGWLSGVEGTDNKWLNTSSGWNASSSHFGTLMAFSAIDVLYKNFIRGKVKIPVISYTKDSVNEVFKLNWWVSLDGGISWNGIVTESIGSGVTSGNTTAQEYEFNFEDVTGDIRMMLKSWKSSGSDANNHNLGAFNVTLDVAMRGSS